MAAITLKNIPDELYTQIKFAAQVHHRSLNNEIIACLERELLTSHVAPDSRIERARELRAHVTKGKVTAKDIESVIREGRP